MNFHFYLVTFTTIFFIYYLSDDFDDNQNNYTSSDKIDLAKSINHDY